MHRFWLTAATAAAVGVWGACAKVAKSPGPVPPAGPAAVAAIGATLDALHAAASAADEEAYFSRFAPDAVFLGTDAHERWTLAQFRAYTHKIFATGRGWTYKPSDRHVTRSRAGAFAWFDEVVTNQRYGRCRGTGALAWQDGEWKVVQYSLSVPIPNAMLVEIVQRIRASPTPPD